MLEGSGCFPYNASVPSRQHLAPKKLNFSTISKSKQFPESAECVIISRAIAGSLKTVFKF